RLREDVWVVSAVRRSLCGCFSSAAGFTQVAVETAASWGKRLPATARYEKIRRSTQFSPGRTEPCVAQCWGCLLSCWRQVSCTRMIREQVQRLREKLLSSEAAVRLAAVQEVSKLAEAPEGTECRKLLFSTLSDPDEGVRLATLDGIGSL